MIHRSPAIDALKICSGMIREGTADLAGFASNARSPEVTAALFRQSVLTAQHATSLCARFRIK
jgi:hypothetical protein